MQPTNTHAMIGPVRDGWGRWDGARVVQWRQESDEDVQYGVSAVVRKIHHTGSSGPIVKLDSSTTGGLLVLYGQGCPALEPELSEDVAIVGVVTL